MHTMEPSADGGVVRTAHGDFDKRSSNGERSLGQILPKYEVGGSRAGPEPEARGTDASRGADEGGTFSSDENVAALMRDFRSSFALSNSTGGASCLRGGTPTIVHTNVPEPKYIDVGRSDCTISPANDRHDFVRVPCTIWSGPAGAIEECLRVPQDVSDLSRALIVAQTAPRPKSIAIDGSYVHCGDVFVYQSLRLVAMSRAPSISDSDWTLASEWFSPRSPDSSRRVVGNPGCISLDCGAGRSGGHLGGLQLCGRDGAAVTVVSGVWHLSGCRVTVTGDACCVKVGAGAKCIVSDCIVVGGLQGIHYLPGSEGHVESCRFQGCDVGVLCAGQAEVQVTGCDFSDAGSAGFWRQHSSDNGTPSALRSRQRPAGTTLCLEKGGNDAETCSAKTYEESRYQLFDSNVCGSGTQVVSPQAAKENGVTVNSTSVCDDEGKSKRNHRKTGVPPRSLFEEGVTTSSPRALNSLTSLGTPSSSAKPTGPVEEVVSAAATGVVRGHALSETNSLNQPSLSAASESGSGAQHAHSLPTMQGDKTSVFSTSTGCPGQHMRDAAARGNAHESGASQTSEAELRLQELQLIVANMTGEVERNGQMIRLNCMDYVRTLGPIEAALEAMVAQQEEESSRYVARIACLERELEQEKMSTGMLQEDDSEIVQDALSRAVKALEVQGEEVKKLVSDKMSLIAALEAEKAKGASARDELSVVQAALDMVLEQEKFPAMSGGVLKIS